jgi:bacterial/archaeal transporter family protein
MERWILYAVLAMFFAGVTGVIAKLGLKDISGDLGMTVRTCFVFVFVVLFAAAVVPHEDYQKLTRHNLLWLGASAATTSVSWIFYYKAIQAGEVSTVALIDKGSFLVAVVLAILFLDEKFTWRTAAGSGLILAGLLVVAKR